MKTTQILLLAATLSAGLLATTGANANLVGSSDGKTVADADFSVTWLADANSAKTSGYDADGLMTWSQAQGWIASLNTAHYLGSSDWRLPTTLLPDASCQYNDKFGSSGFNCRGSEMGHLFYNEFMGSGGYGPRFTPGFSNLQTSNSSNFYWSSTDAPNDSTAAEVFDFSVGFQSSMWKFGTAFAIAVRTEPVPAPAAVWLLGSGLLGLIGVARRKVA